MLVPPPMPSPVVVGVGPGLTPTASASTTPTTTLLPGTRATGVAIEGKSLFTCSQCGALLKFRPHTTPIEARIAALRAVPIDPVRAPDDNEQHPQEPTAAPASSPSSSSASTLASTLASISTSPSPPPSRAVVITEIVWENQQQGPGPVDAATWQPLAQAPYISANRGDIGRSLEETIPNRLLSKAHLWLSETWAVDQPSAGGDGPADNASGDSGWLYGADADAAFARDVGMFLPAAALAGDGNGGQDTDAPRIRRRRHLRKRQTDGSDLSWFQELLDCSSLLLQKKTPSCHDCEGSIIQHLQQSLNHLEADQQQYQAFLTELPGHEPHHGEQVDALAAEIDALEAEERRLTAELATLNAESNHVMSKRRELWSTGADLEQLIRGTFAEGAFLQHLLGLSRDERQSVGVFSVHASDMLRRLQRYNVCNDVFHIWHDGLFGTINGLRLGRLPTRPVEWVEINAALGQAVLLLATIAEKAQLDFTRNKLVPRGSFSRVVNMYGKEYSLYSDGGMFRRRGFNQAMVLFLECVDDAGKRAMRDDPSLKFPYKIQRGKIGDLPISLGNDEQWTKALKYMLTHLKWLLAWVAKRSS